jgi:hypothetical protein
VKQVGSREFQLTYQRAKEPLKVVALRTSKIIGYFYPVRDLEPPCTECGIEQRHHEGMTHDYARRAD